MSDRLPFEPPADGKSFYPSHISERKLAIVENILKTDGDGMLPRDVFACLGEGSPRTVQQILRELIRQGRARRGGPDYLYRYWRV